MRLGIVPPRHKLRDKFEVPADITEDAAKAQALACGGVQRHMEGKEPFKVIYVPGKLVNIVAGEPD